MDPFDGDDCIDLPTYVSFVAEQSDGHTNIRRIQSPIPPDADAGTLKGPGDVDTCGGGTLLVHGSNRSSLTASNDSSDESPAHYRTRAGAANAPHVEDSENKAEESDIAMPLNYSIDGDSEDIPLISLSSSHVHHVLSASPGDLKKESLYRGGLLSSKIMKRSSSVISDSGIESEPSSVAWPVEASLRGRPPVDCCSERGFSPQIVGRRPIHRSSLEGLQMESNGSLPSAGIQASLTSISSLPYEEDQHQRKISKLTKSVSAPQISSPEDNEEDQALLEHMAESVEKHQVSQKIGCSSLTSNLDSDHPESPELGTSSASDFSFVVSSETSNQDKGRPMKVSSGVPEGTGLDESAKNSDHRLMESVIGRNGENLNDLAHISGVNVSLMNVHLIESEAGSCRCENKPCGHESKSTESLEDQEELKLSNNLHVNVNAASQRPGDRSGLTDCGKIPSSDSQPKSSKIPNSGLAFVNKKMVEVVNMSVSCAPTCLPFSSVLRDSPSISGMSNRQATSPITHQPLGSFGIISSTSLNLLNMDEETNERMLK